MNISTLYEISSNDKLLTSLGLAVAEAKFVRSLLRSKSLSNLTNKESGHVKRLDDLNREIDYLEAKLLEVQSKANRNDDTDLRALKTVANTIENAAIDCPRPGINS